MSESELWDSPVTKTLLIVDGHALIYRAFYAFPPLTTPDGQIVGAVYGFLRTLFTVLKQVEPTHWLVAFDHPAPTKRKLEHDFYKANRPEMPDELKPQISIIEEAVTRLGIPEFKVAGIEADDIIGTVSKRVSENKWARVQILTGDKDSFQLVDDEVHVLVPNAGRRQSKSVSGGGYLTEYNPALVEQKMQVPPTQIIDFKALAGDGSDNIPGVPGIGAKTAVALIKKYGSVEKIYQLLDQDGLEAERSGVVAKLVAGRESALISQHLATIDREVELDFDFAKCEVCCYQKDEMTQFLQNLGFNSLLKLLPDDDFDNQLQAALF